MKSKTKSVARIRRNAVHEAGHAVVAWHFGVRFRHVTIVPEGDSLGHLRVFRQKLEGLTDDQFKRKAAIDYAGGIAERIYAPRAYRHWHAAHDFENTAQLVLRHFGSVRQADAYLRFVRIVTEDILKLRWPLVIALSSVLIRRRTMTGDEVFTFLSTRAMARGKR